MTLTKIPNVTAGLLVRKSVGRKGQHRAQAQLYSLWSVKIQHNEQQASDDNHTRKPCLVQVRGPEYI